MNRSIPIALFLFALVACDSEVPLVPDPGVIEEGEGEIGPPAATEPVAPVSPGKGGVTDELSILKTGARGSGGGVTITRADAPDPTSLGFRLIGVAYSWGEKSKGVQKLLHLTTRPQGAPNWPWITLDAWIPARGSLAEWTNRELTVHKCSLMPGQGKSPWIPTGRSTITLMIVAEGRLKLKMDLGFRDPVDGNLKRVTGKVVAIEGDRPSKKPTGGK